jgi:hypothetical protein
VEKSSSTVTVWAEATELAAAILKAITTGKRGPREREKLKDRIVWKGVPRIMPESTPVRVRPRKLFFCGFRTYKIGLAPAPLRARGFSRSLRNPRLPMNRPVAPNPLAPHFRSGERPRADQKKRSAPPPARRARRLGKSPPP